MIHSDKFMSSKGVTLKNQLFKHLFLGEFRLYESDERGKRWCSSSQNWMELGPDFMSYLC